MIGADHVVLFRKGVIMFGLGLPELVVVFVILFLLFGAKRVPELASGLGQGIRIFKKSLSEDPNEPKNKELQIETKS